MIFSIISNKPANASLPQSSAQGLATRIGALGLAACLLVTGCSKVEESTTSVETTAEQALADSGTAESTPDMANNRTKAAVVPEGKPVSYDVENWKSDDSKRLEPTDLKQLQRKLGKVTVTDENSLDYASNTAIKYRFMKGDEPYLDIIDSQEYLEFGWYYANPNDSDSEKKMSIDHAKKMYQVAAELMGSEGSQLVANMLSGQITKNKKIGERQVELAKCEFYSCMLVLKK